MQLIFFFCVDKSFIHLHVLAHHCDMEILLAHRAFSCGDAFLTLLLIYQDSSNPFCPCLGCDNVPFSNLTMDACGVCGGTNSVSGLADLDVLVFGEIAFTQNSNFDEDTKCSSQRTLRLYYFEGIPCKLLIFASKDRSASIKSLGGTPVRTRCDSE